MILLYVAHKRYRKEGWGDRNTDFATEWKTEAWNRFGLAENVTEMRWNSMEWLSSGFENKRCEKALHRPDVQRKGNAQKCIANELNGNQQLWKSMA